MAQRKPRKDGKKRPAILRIPSHATRLRRSIAEQLRQSFQTHQTERIRFRRAIAKFEATSTDYRSELDSVSDNITVLERRIASLEKENDFYRDVIDQYFKYRPPLFRLPGPIIRGVLESARIMSQLDQILKINRLEYTQHKQSWRIESRRVRRAAAKSRKHQSRVRELERILQNRRRTTAEMEIAFDDFVWRIVSDPEIDLLRQFTAINQNERQLARQKIMLAETEMELLRIYRDMAIHLECPNHFIEELGRQIYVQRGIGLIEQQKLPPGK